MENCWTRAKTGVFCEAVEIEDVEENSAFGGNWTCVLSSAGFARNDRQSQFLRFLVERHLEGRDNELKESVIAVEVFGRDPGYDPKLDGIVRTEAMRLRARLDKYYADEGSRDPLVIELPKGGYRPVFRDASDRAGGPEAPIRRGYRWVAAALAAVVRIAARRDLVVDPPESRPRHGRCSAAREPRSRSGQRLLCRRPHRRNHPQPLRHRRADGAVPNVIVRAQGQRAGYAVRPASSSGQITWSKVPSCTPATNCVSTSRWSGSRDDSRLWSDRFDRKLTDVFAIQDEISRGIVNTCG